MSQRCSRIVRIRVVPGSILSAEIFSLRVSMDFLTPPPRTNRQTDVEIESQNSGKAKSPCALAAVERLLPVAVGTGWVDPRAGLDAAQKGHILPLPRIEP
jgi:hypothetical protein